ncbi:Uncharacterised protein [Vibrio cholerae]|nr:Uncharacterised protein [Vibrio cholerae]CSI82365.1 Uncharacterised protein [Vibrio cholerae]
MDRRNRRKCCQQGFSGTQYRPYGPEYRRCIYPLLHI